MGNQWESGLRVADSAPKRQHDPVGRAESAPVRPAMPVFYDTHGHLDYPDFAGDLDQVIDRAAKAGVEKIISIGTNLESSVRAVRLAERFPGVYAAVGWHPCEASAAPADLRPELRELARHPKVVALGETGLDYHRGPGDA